MGYFDRGGYRSYMKAADEMDRGGAAVSVEEEKPATDITSTAEELEKNTIRVLIVDDHTLIREGLSQLFALEEDLQVVGEAVDGFMALEQIRRLQPDVVLMDINLPVMDGIAVTRQVGEQFPGVAVIMLTMHRQKEQVVEAMRNGARGYLLKSSSARELVQAIRIVYAGGVAITPSLTGILVDEVRSQQQRYSESDLGGRHVAQLSDKEIELIRYLATGMSNKEIAQQLAYSEKTVKNYLSIIFQKLHLRDRTQVAIFALRQGLLPDNEL